MCVCPRVCVRVCVCVGLWDSALSRMNGSTEESATLIFLLVPSKTREREREREREKTREKCNKTKQNGKCQFGTSL